jgi:hypothetical protein
MYPATDMWFPLEFILLITHSQLRVSNAACPSACW